MARREKFGKLVLLEEIDTTGLGIEHRAAKLGPAGLEKIVSVLRLKPAISSHAEAAKSLMDQVKLAAQLQSPNILKIYGIGRVDATYYVTHEYVEGKSLRAIFERCRQEGFPFSVDHALLIASKICSALEYAHARKGDGGARYFHGLLTPASVLVSYEGEIRVRGFGAWASRIREATPLTEAESLYLSPEQAGGGAGDTRCDIFAVGAMLYEALTGRALFAEGRDGDIAARLASARLQNPTSDDDSLPKPIAEILRRALAADPAGRYAEVQEMRKAIDTLLFSGDFTPTTFNLAFFMHSLFRDDIERETRALKDEREASYAEFLIDETARATPLPARGPAAQKAEVVDSRLVAAARADAGAQPDHAAAGHATPAAAHPASAHAAPQAGHHVTSPSAADTPGLTAREAAAGFTFHKEERSRKTPIVAGVAVLLLLVAAGYFYFRGNLPGAAPAPSAAPPTLSPEAEAAMARVKELEQKLQQLEAEKAAAQAKAAEDAKKKVEAQAAARGQAVDPLALQRAEEDARRRARAEQERKQLEEQRRLEEEKKAEEARLAEERRKLEEQAQAEEAARVAALAAAAATTTTTTLPPPTTTLPPLRPGTLVNLSDPGVIAPVVDKAPALIYPPIAHRQRVEGTVELNVLIDEKGTVTDAQIVSGAGGKAGLNEAAIDNVKRRRYRPAMKEGVPVKVWVAVRVKFELPD